MKRDEISCCSAETEMIHDRGTYDTMTGTTAEPAVQTMCKNVLTEHVRSANSDRSNSEKISPDFSYVTQRDSRRTHGQISSGAQGRERSEVAIDVAK